MTIQQAYARLLECGIPYPILKVYRALEGDLRCVLLIGEEEVRFTVENINSAYPRLVYLP